MSAFATRSREPEILDDRSVDGAVLADALRGIALVNRWLGGTRVLLGAFERALADPELAARRPLVVHDLGCGGGDGLRALARWGRRRGVPLRLRGFDASPAALALARGWTRGYPEIELAEADVLAPDFEPRGADVVTLNLFLHHLGDDEIDALLARCRRAGVRAVIVNDLQRSALAHALFRALCAVAPISRVARLDGLASIRKAFRGAELERVARRAGAREHELRRRWAFRYELVLRFGAVG